MKKKLNFWFTHKPLIITSDKNELQSRPHSAPPLHAPYDNTSDEEDLDSLDDKKLREIQLRSIFLKSLPSLGFLEKEIADLLSGKFEL